MSVINMGLLEVDGLVATESSTVLFGGGVFLSAVDNAKLSRLEITDNTAGSEGGGTGAGSCASGRRRAPRSAAIAAD